MRGLRAALASLRAFAQDSRGNATVEFIIVVPVLMMLVFSIYEAGWFMVRSTMLDRGLDMAVRDLRLGLIANPTHDELKKRVCAHTTVIKNCETTLVLELTPFNLGAGPGLDSPVCVDRSSKVEPVFTYKPGIRSEIMFVRACSIVDPLFPLMGFAAAMTRNEGGEFAIIAHSAFANEPE